jgi:hypothetical protein
MKKQKQKNIGTEMFGDMVQNHKMKEVSPPEGANRNMLDGKQSMTVKDAAATWFKAAKQQNPSSGFLEVPSEGLKPNAAFDREMLYKGKKK